MKHYPRFPGDYLKKTLSLTLAQDGAYGRLLDHYYSTEQPLPCSMAEIYMIARCVSDRDRTAVDVVLRKFFEATPDGWIHERVEEELGKFREKSDKASAAGRMSAEARERRNKELRKFRLDEARAKGTHSDIEWQELVSACGDKCVRCGAVGSLQKDHIVPIYQGGSDSIENLQPLCKACNTSKGPEAFDHRPLDWRSTIVQRTLNDRAKVRSTNHNHNHSSKDSQNSSNSSNLVGQEPDVTPQTLNGKALKTKEFRAAAVRILTFLNEKTGSKFEPVPSNVDMIVARLKEGFTEKIARQVVANRVATWKADPKMEEYLRPKTLFAAANFASYSGLIGKTDPVPEAP